MAVHDLVSRCPYCGVRNDGHSNAAAEERHAPCEGSVSLCASCKGVAVFERAGGGLRLRRPSSEEAAEMLRDEGFRELLHEASRLSPGMLRRGVPYVWR